MSLARSTPFKTLYPSDALAENLDARLADVEAAVRALSNNIQRLSALFETATRLGCVRPLPVRSSPRLERILAVVSDKMNGGRPLLGGNQPQKVRQRHVVMAIAREQGYSYGEIGTFLRRHHTTVVYGARKVKDDPILEVIRAEMKLVRPMPQPVTGGN